VTGGVGTRLPSGSQRRGLGGEASIEPFLAAGVALGHFGLLAETAYSSTSIRISGGRNPRN